MLWSKYGNHVNILLSYHAISFVVGYFRIILERVNNFSFKDEINIKMA